MSDGVCGEAPDDWIPLKAAFSHAHAIEEARLGVKRPRGVLLTEPNAVPLWAPTTPELENLLRDTRDIVVRHPEHERDKRKLSLSDIAASVAHRRLMTTFHAGGVPVRAKGTGEWFERGQEVQDDHIPIPPSFWRSEAHRSGKLLSPVPDYTTGTILDTGWDLSLKFSGSIDRAEVSRRHLVEALESPDFPEVSGGIFRYEGGAWQVACGECSATVRGMKGMGYLAVLLTHPGTYIRWDGLDKAGAAAAKGKPPRKWEKDVFMEPDYYLEWEDLMIKKRNREEELRSIRKSIRTLKKYLATASKERQLKISEDIYLLKIKEESAKNAANRIDTPWDLPRARVQHGLRAALQHLAVLCPAFIRHVGSYQERGSLQSNRRANGMRYMPSPNGSLRRVEWDTEPRK